MSAFKFTLYIKNLVSLRSRRLEVMGERENGRAQGRHGPNACSAGYLLVDNSSMPRTKKKNTFTSTLFRCKCGARKLKSQISAKHGKYLTCILV